MAQILTKQAFIAAVLFSSSLTVVQAQTASGAPILDSPAEIKQIIQFMTTPSHSGGITFVGTAGSLKGLILPLSYTNSADYWAKYVCELPGNNCTVKDVYDASEYTLKPDKASPGGDLQVERVNVNFGSNIYDAATWQIALALAGANGEEGPGGKSLFDIANNQNTLLYYSYSGNADENGAIFGANRATTREDVYRYNNHQILRPLNAFNFRMVPRSFISQDPFLHNSEYLNKYVTAVNLPTDNPAYRQGTITWLDWKPIAGENSWAFLLGPLQAAQIQYKAFPHTDKFVPFNSRAVQNALDSLVAFQYMQSQVGAFYYATSGSLGNTGPDLVDPYQVSVENNASALGGLLVLQNVLQQDLRHDPDAIKHQEKIEGALKTIHAMIYGGETIAGHTKGVLNFLKIYAWDPSKGVFISGGFANKPNFPEWVAFSDGVEPVDVTTWGLSVLGQPLLDSWHGFGTAYKAWEGVKASGGYFGADGTLWGVGYSNQDEHTILSGEWTMGAITMTQALITQYQLATENTAVYTPVQRARAIEYVALLTTDRDNMIKHLKSLRTDFYPTEKEFDAVRPANYAQLMPTPQGMLGYVYASKRYFIPFGWYANPLPSLASTAWALMWDYGFNPFSVNGTYDANALGLLLKPVNTVIYNHVADAKIGVNYRQVHTSEDEWKTGPVIDIGDKKEFVFPAGANEISISYTKDNKQWFQACVLASPAELTMQEVPIVIKAIWTNVDGTGACEIGK